MKTVSNRRNRAPADLGLEKIGLGVFLYAYAVFLGACYLFAFWRPIGFNIFPYLSIQDYLSAPLNRIAVLIAIPLIFAATFLSGARNGQIRFKGYILIYLIFLYTFVFVSDFYQATSLFLDVNFYFENEKSVLLIAALLFTIGAGLAIYSFRALPWLPLQITALVLVQAAVSMIAGYKDGKTVYNGAQQVYFLENKEVCEKDGVRDWLHLGTFSSQTFFMNTIDKRLCITDQKNLLLVSRKVKERL